MEGDSSHAADEENTAADLPRRDLFNCFAAYYRKKDAPQNLDNVLHIHQGPFDADALADASNISLDMHLGLIFRQPVVRRAFEKRQMPFVRLRSVIIQCITRPLMACTQRRVPERMLLTSRMVTS